MSGGKRQRGVVRYPGRTTVTLTAESWQRVAELAEIEKRDIAQMCRVLIDEALETRATSGEDRKT